MKKGGASLLPSSIRSAWNIAFLLVVVTTHQPGLFHTWSHENRLRNCKENLQTIMRSSYNERIGGSSGMKTIKLTKLILALAGLSCFQPVVAQTTMRHHGEIDDSLSRGMSCCKCQNSWNFDADFLYWSTNFNAISGINVGVQTADNAADAIIQVTHPTQKWDPGVKLAAGWTSCNNWSIDGMWTYFYNSNRSNRTPFDLQINADSFHTQGSSRFTFKYNAADFVLGKSLCFGRCFLIRPLMGVHAIWTQIQSNLNLTAPATSGTSIETDGFTIGLHLGSKAWGIGPQLGVHTLWGNIKGFSLVGNICGALVYGQHQVKANVEADIVSNVDVSVHLAGRSYWGMMSTIQIQSGFCYAFCFCNHELKIQALWEGNLINQANNLLIFERSISTQGLTLGAIYSF